MNGEWKADDLLFRQVHPNFLSGGLPNSQAFCPTPKDAGKLSVDDASLISAGDSWRHFTEDLRFASAGTWAVSIAEVGSVEDLVVLRDPIEDEQEPAKSNPAHCAIDFNQLTSKGQRKKRAQKLAIFASARRCQFEPQI